MWTYIVLAAMLGLAQARTCGQQKVSGIAIVGGEDSVPGEWPWQVGIRNDPNCCNEYHMCGGSLISNEWVVTAGHCFYREKKLQPYSFTLGSYMKDTVDANQETRQIVESIVHPGYDDNSLTNDIALIRLAAPVAYTDYIQPVCLPSQDSDVAAGTTCTVTGWGDTESLLNPGNKLQEVEVPAIARAVCNQPEYLNGEVLDTMICVGTLEGGKDSCQGDSGGPLVTLSTDGSWQLDGIVSWGYGCADAGNPGVYTRVGLYREWIESITGLTFE